MLTPKYLSDCPERMLELYAQLEMDILSDMARKIKAYEVFPSSANWQKERLRLMGETYEEILKRLSAATGKTVSELKALLQEAGIKTMASDDEIYRKAGKGITPLDASESVKRVLSAGLTKTASSFANDIRCIRYQHCNQKRTQGSRRTGHYINPLQKPDRHYRNSCQASSSDRHKPDLRHAAGSAS